MRIPFALILFSLFFCCAIARGQADRNEPHIGYLYPSGGQQGTVVRIMAGGQFLRGVKKVHVSGGGIQASLIRYNGRVRRLNREERKELQRRLTELREPGNSEKPGKEKVRRRPDRAGGRKEGDGDKAGKEKKNGGSETAKLPNHPLLNDLDSLSPQELEFVAHEFLRFDKKKQPNAQIAETAVIEVRIDPGALAGDRELRLETQSGLTNPLCFQVGVFPEVCEHEPFDTGAAPTPPFELPILLNGQIKPGDADRFRFRAQQGQKLVIDVSARHLIPYLADAVPGWFQATLALFDSRGKEVAYVDDYTIHPDPVLFFEVPETGLYELEIRDSIYRGREDFIYRIAVGDSPFIRSMFPLGGPAGGETVVSIEGWNLDSKRLCLDTGPGSDGIRQTALHSGGRLSNPVSYAVSGLPECNEAEPNDTPQAAMRIKLPRTVNGRIAEPGDEDLFRFKGRAGEEVVAEVLGRRMNSPLDSLLRLEDSRGRVLAWNDDHQDRQSFLHRDMGLITHHADSYLRAKLPRSGVYFIRLSDSQSHGGAAHGYRLRISPPQPDFALRVTPSTINVGAGRTVPFTVHVLRKDGFDGPIEVALKDAPPGFVIRGGTVPESCHAVRMTLTAPRKPLGKPLSLEMEGTAQIGGQSVSRSAVPAEDMMQAFLYRHLVPCQALTVATVGARARFPAPELVGDSPLRIPAGGTALLRFKLPKRGKIDNVALTLNDPPEGIALVDVTFLPGVVKLQLQSDREKIEAGSSGNLIVEAFTERPGRNQKGKSAGKKKRISLGVLPAVPFEIVRR